MKRFALCAYAVIVVLQTRDAAANENSVLARYLDALAHHRYDAAFALLDARERVYFRTVPNYASTFRVDAFALQTYRIESAHAGRVAVVRERVAFDDPAHDLRVTTTIRVPYVIRGTGSAARIVDAGRPWRARALSISAEAGGVRIALKRLAYYARFLRFVVRFQNDGERFVTILPYLRSVVRDGTAVYGPLETNDWRMTDRQLFLGLRLAPHSRYTAALAFVTPRLNDRERALILTIGPALREGADAPAAVALAVPAPR